MTIKIVTDSTSDLPLEYLEKFDISLIPLYINFKDRGYIDGVEITRQEFYEMLPDQEIPPTTATPSIEAVLDLYQKLADQGADQIISLHISEALSATVDVARKAAERAPIPVTVIDSGQLSMGLGFQVLYAARAAQKGESLESILSELKNREKHLYVFAALDTLDYLRRSGRMSRIVAGIGSILHVKPILKMNLGKPASELVRTQTKAIQKLIDTIKHLGPIEEFALVHTNAPQAAQELWEKVKSFIPDQNFPISVNVTPVLGSHLGPGAVGFAFKGKSTR
jgi:DegV family protein with EDD domain